MNLRQHPELPANPRPIVVIGAGGIIKHAHLPAYRMCGWDVHSVFDIRPEAAREVGAEFGVAVSPSLEQSIKNAPPGAVFDIAVPAVDLLGILSALPDGSAVLAQKPMGENLEQARAIRDISRRKALKMAVNFQLRYAPYSLAARDLIARGELGEILEVDFKVHVHTPWAIWYFLEKAPRMEILYHSIHYLDMIRALLGNPRSVKATTIRHPASPKLHSSRSSILLDYGSNLRAQVVTYHAHDYGPKHQASEVRIEGSKGAIAFQMGLNMNYPDGEADWFEYCLGKASGWQSVALEGSWFPHAFRGTMASVMLWADDEARVPETNFEDAFRTMCLVEAAYIDSEKPGTPIPSD